MNYDHGEQGTPPEAMTDEPRRPALLAGAASAILLVASFGLIGETPNSEEPAQDVVSFYAEHGSDATSSAMLCALGAVFFLFFVGRLGHVLQRSQGATGGLAEVVRAGGAVAAVGMLILAALYFTLGEASAALERRPFRP